ncbi:MAG: ribonuclease HII [Myxococcota bacterium]|jgi:ribonuclease HII|nr:ribonuclease HII [Myxococcota bacterium]
MVKRAAQLLPGLVARVGEIEEGLHEAGLRVFIGTDEAGRGPLAGPVVSAAVYLEQAIPGLNDSKKLSAQRRDALFDEISGKAMAFAIAERDWAHIDEHNILASSLDAMREAVEQLAVVLEGRGLRVQRVLVDGNRLIPSLSQVQTAYVKGDGRSYNIAAASILAKVHRDRLMRAYDERYPGYGFARHMGYPTAAHYEALRRLGPSPIHRLSFRGVLGAGS